MYVCMYGWRDRDRDTVPGLPKKKPPKKKRKFGEKLVSKKKCMPLLSVGCWGRQHPIRMGCWHLPLPHLTASIPSSSVIISH